MKHSFYLFIFFLIGSVQCVYSQQFEWAQGVGALGSDVATAIAHDDQGNVYITGNVAGGATFGNTYIGGTAFEVFMAKYSGTGSLEWAKSYGGLTNEKAQSIAYHRNFLYVCGFFEGTATFGSTTLTSVGAYDVFIMKTDLEGNVIWAKQAGGVNSEVAYGIAVDDVGNAYVCGTYKTAMSAGSLNISTTNLFIESFVLSTDANGNFRWVKSTAGNSNNSATGIAYNKNKGISVCGYFDNRLVVDGTQLNTSSPSYDAYLASFDDNGNLNWAKKAGSSSEDQASAVTCDAQGNTYMVGYYGAEATFGANTLAFTGWNDLFVAKYDNTGNVLWARSAGGGKLDVANAVTLDNDGNVYIAGLFENYAVFNGTAITDSDRGIYLASYDAIGNFRFVQPAGGVQTDAALAITVHNKKAYIAGYYLFTCYFGNIGVQMADNNDLFIAAYNIPEVLSVNKLTSENLNVFPNPLLNTLIIQSQETFTNVALHDVLGKEVFAVSVDNVQQKDIDVSHLTSGIYFVCVQNGAYSVKKKVFKL